MQVKWESIKNGNGAELLNGQRFSKSEEVYRIIYLITHKSNVNVNFREIFIGSKETRHLWQKYYLLGFACLWPPGPTI